MESHTPKEEKDRYRLILSGVVVCHSSIAHSICRVLGNGLMTRLESIVPFMQYVQV